MISVNQIKPEEIISPKDHEFIDFVNNRITIYGQIPYTVPEKLIVDLIKSSAKYFYTHYDNSWYKTYYLIKKSTIKQFIGNDGEQALALRVSPRIRIIKKIHSQFDSNYFKPIRSGGNNFGGNITTNLGSQNIGGYFGVDNHLYGIEQSAQMSEISVLNAVFKESIAFSFTDETGILILHRNPPSNIILSCYCDIPIHNLYKNSFFERHVIASVKKELKRLLGSHTFELVGGTIINAEEICAGWEDMEKVEDLIKAGSGIGDIILKR